MSAGVLAADWCSPAERRSAHSTPTSPTSPEMQASRSVAGRTSRRPTTVPSCGCFVDGVERSSRRARTGRDRADHRPTLDRRERAIRRVLPGNDRRGSRSTTAALSPAELAEDMTTPVDADVRSGRRTSYRPCGGLRVRIASPAAIDSSGRGNVGAVLGASWTAGRSIRRSARLLGRCRGSRPCIVFTGPGCGDDGVRLGPSGSFAGRLADCLAPADRRLLPDRWQRSGGLRTGPQRSGCGRTRAPGRRLVRARARGDRRAVDQRTASVASMGSGTPGRGQRARRGECAAADVVRRSTPRRLVRGGRPNEQRRRRWIDARNVLSRGVDGRRARSRRRRGTPCGPRRQHGADGGPRLALVVMGSSVPRPWWPRVAGDRLLDE